MDNKGTGFDNKHILYYKPAHITSLKQLSEEQSCNILSRIGRICLKTERTLARLPLLLSLLLASCASAACSGRAIDEPIEYLDGDYIVAAIFKIGSFVQTSPDNQTHPDGYCLNFTHKSFWGIQRALTFRRTMLAERTKLRYTHNFVFYHSYFTWII